MTPGWVELRRWTLEVLRELGIKPSEKLGQHFLVDPVGLRLFIEPLSRLGPLEMLEVGPGLGVITRYASEIASRIVAVELDPRLASYLQSSMPGNVAVILGDGVEHAMATRVSVVYSNTPYSISSPLIAAIARNNNVAHAILGVQLELAMRIVARLGEESYGRLTLLANRYFNVRLVGVIPRSSYYPEPEVSGAVVELHRRREWVEGDEVFENLTRCLFSERNKKASKVASRCLGVGVEELSWLGGRRVRELTLEDVEKLLAMTMRR